MQDTEVAAVPVVVRAREIAELARGMADQIDSDRRLPPDLVGALRDSGLLRAGAPVEVDALELPAGTA
jgi:indole-3-acetate monooxygenase